MYRKYAVVNIVTIVFLLYFCIYAVSPLSFSVDLSGKSKAKFSNYKGFKVFTVQALLDAVFSVDAPVSGASENAGILFVKKAYAVFRDCNIAVIRLIEVYCSVNPLSSWILLSLIFAARLSFFASQFSIRKNQVGIKAFPGFRSLTSGLSPPSPFL